MTEKEREEMWRIIGRILESLDRLIESQKEDREKAREMDERINRLVELRKIQKESYKNLTKSISDLNGTWQNYTEYAARKYGLRLIQPAFKPPIRRIKGEDFEIDGIAVGLDFVIVIETKTKPTRKAINLKRFLKFYPEYRNYRIYGAIAGIKDLAESKGFFVIKHKDGKDVKILNEKNFKPKDYSRI